MKSNFLGVRTQVEIISRKSAQLASEWYANYDSIPSAGKNALSLFISLLMNSPNHNDTCNRIKAISLFENSFG